MSALSPDDPVFLSGLLMTICVEQEGQRQTPVAVEKQRSVTHRQACPDAGVRLDRIRQLSAGQFPALIVLMTSVASMKWVFVVAVATRRRFYARDRKGNGTIFGSANQPAEPNLPPLILIMTPAAQMLRNFQEIGSRKITAHARVPRTPALLRRSCAERFSFHLPTYPSAGIQPRSDRTVPR
jgi:hypothetical protein